jgi:hypothetical protein
VLGLLAVALGKPVYDGLSKDLAAASPEHLAAIANQSYGQVILHSAFVNHPELAECIPQDLVIYFAEMQRANHVRNQQAMVQLQEIAQVLATNGIHVLALKGVADMLEPIHRVSEHRYISDLDLLIPADRAQEAATLLRQHKGLPISQKLIRPGTHHHLAQINHPDWLFSIELHVQPGSETTSSVLNAALMLENVRPSHIEGLFLPSIEDRLLHSVLHGMELRHETASINLRLLADHVQYLHIAGEKILKQALTRLDSVGLAAWLEDLTTLARGLAGVERIAAETWAARALRAFGEPSSARERDNAFWVRHYFRRLRQSSSYRRQTLRKVISPKAWAEFIAFHKDRRGKFK